jgi:hypothetical protein
VDHDFDASLAAILERGTQLKADAPGERLLLWHRRRAGSRCASSSSEVPDRRPHVNDRAAFAEGILGGGLAVLKAFWDHRERPTGAFHGALPTRPLKRGSVEGSAASETRPGRRAGVRVLAAPWGRRGT